MAVFSKIAALAAIGASLVWAVPVAGPPKLNTHKAHIGANGVQFTTYHPLATYETFLDGSPVHASLIDAGASKDQAAIAFLAIKLGVAADSLEIRSEYEGDNSTHVYVSQKLNGIAVANGVANVVFDKSMQVVAYGANLIKPSDVSSATSKINEPTAIAAAEKALGGTYNDWPVKAEHVYQGTTKARLAYVVQVQNDKSWFEAFVDAQTGTVINAIDFVAHASYRVVPFNLLAQWLASGQYDLVDNNSRIISFKSTTSATTAESASSLVFDYAWSSTTAVNLNVARTNALFIANSYHDPLYKYGFTEKAFNFQDNNFGKGGVGADNIQMSVQASGTDNSNFAKGQRNMYLWDFTSPDRDGDLSNDVITHEFTHGLTNRMTGGGTGRCLSTTEAGGMGEGWSDTLSFWTEQKNATVVDLTLGGWVYNSQQ
ncbi:hypothetical protein FRB96_001300 [Tulasnella sp. 330]|nr:hypothetical protein FRB96_001300 [Tulasnella sp. 330]